MKPEEYDLEEKLDKIAERISDLYITMAKCVRELKPIPLDIVYEYNEIVLCIQNKEIK